MPKEILDQVSSERSLDQPPLQPGDIGENITTVGVDLFQLGRGTKLRFVSGEEENDDDDDSRPGATTIVITGLRNPCYQIDKFRSGLKEKFVIRDESRNIVGRLAGVMATVETGGEVRPGMRIVIEEPAEYLPLEVV
jgi:MOSC domain-containing protein YiiM